MKSARNGIMIVTLSMMMVLMSACGGGSGSGGASSSASASTSAAQEASTDAAEEEATDAAEEETTDAAEEEATDAATEETSDDAAAGDAAGNGNHYFGMTEAEDGSSIPSDDWMEFENGKGTIFVGGKESAFTYTEEENEAGVIMLMTMDDGAKYMGLLMDALGTLDTAAISPVDDFMSADEFLNSTDIDDPIMMVQEGSMFYEMMMSNQ